MNETKIGIGDIFHSSGSLKIKTIKFFDLLGGSLLIPFLPAKKSTNAPTTVTRLLIIRPGGIGDAIFLLPILKLIRQKQPSLGIDILCEKRNSSVFLSQPDLNLKVYHRDILRELLSVLKNTYDVVIDTEQWHYASALVSYFVKSKFNTGFQTRPLRRKLFNRTVPYEMDAYELDNFKKLFEGIWGSLDQLKDINACYQVSPDSASWANLLIKPQSISVFLGASIPERRLTHEQSLALIRPLLNKNRNVILLGGGDVKDTSLKLEQEINSPHLHNFVGKTSIAQSAAIIQKNALFIGTDSGLMHLACAVGTPAIAIFGPGNLKKWGPRGEKHSIITENVECSPCTRFGYTTPTCRGTYHCMRDIDMGQFEKIIQERYGIK